MVRCAAGRVGSGSDEGWVAHVDALVRAGGVGLQELRDPAGLKLRCVVAPGSQDDLRPHPVGDGGAHPGLEELASGAQRLAERGRVRVVHHERAMRDKRATLELAAPFDPLGECPTGGFERTVTCEQAQIVLELREVGERARGSAAATTAGLPHPREYS